MIRLPLAVAAAAVLAMAAPLAHAATLSIDDLAESLALTVDKFNQSTSSGTPGSGNAIDITTPTPSNGISNIQYNPGLETLSFTFANQIAWGGDVYLYRYFTEAGSGLSDLFVIQGYGGQAPDYITFISDPGPLSGDPIADGVARLAGSTATPTDLGTVAETGDWQLAYNTGPDQYYIRSDVPEPATLALLTAGLLGVGFLRLRRSK